MARGQQDSSPKPIPEDGRTDVDYRGGPLERPDLEAALAERIDGEVRFDEYSRGLYATDASIYEVTPVGVVFPTSTADVAAVVTYCADQEIPVLPRGGGTSLAGQTVNEAVVLDFTRYMDDVLELDAEGKTARVQPGAILGRINAVAEEYDLTFAPDPAWGDKSAIGGAIGNNSTGAHSLQYGKTDAYLRELEVVLADGTVTTLGEVTLSELRERADPDGGIEARLAEEARRLLENDRSAVESGFPDLHRNVSGYNLDGLLESFDEAEGTLNLAPLVAGSEGTLAVVTEATIELVPEPETKSLALLAYEDLLDAMADVPAILQHDPAAVEVLDDVLLDLARDTTAFEEEASMVPDGTRAVLLVEFFAEDDQDGKRQIAELLADRVPAAGTSVGLPADRTETDAAVRAFDALEAHDETTRKRFWKLRKSGLPILLGRTSDAKHVAFIEDTAVPPENLADYVADVREVLDEHDTYASFYAHAGPGVLHIRPLVNTKTDSGVADIESLGDEISDLVVEYGGSVSGEHGDGRARSQWNRKLYGETLWKRFLDLKSAMDPDWLLNPGQVCGVDVAAIEAGEAPARAATVDLTEDLRMGPEYDFEAPFEPALEWSNENGLQGMVELCHGCGGCRGDQDTTGGVMCPTYRATREESTTTRGRANMLRRGMSGELSEGALFEDEFREEILDLCIGCKGCSRDCPSEVDLAKLKAELTHADHRENGASRREHLFANFDRLARWGSASAPVSNWLTALPGTDWLAERVLGIARERDLPPFHRESLQDWFSGREPAVSAAEANRHVLLFADSTTAYSYPAIGKAAVRVLEAADVHVDVLDRTDSGRPAHSLGFLDRSRSIAESVLDEIGDTLESTPSDADVAWDLVAIEPSDAVMFQSDYRDLLGDEALPVAENAYGLCEYLDRHRLAESLPTDGATGASDASAEALTYHGHCHQKATNRDHHAVAVLRRAGYTVDALDSGCCGMAGSFGYEAEHVSLSMAIGEILFEQVADSEGERVVAPGTSCRHQLAARDGGGRPEHPAEALDRLLE
jgi:FAD/FMN-containing dehydrogenase/Fe-S oxidoreductase